MSNWQVARLGDICDKITDGTHHSPANHPEGDFKYITAKNIKPWGLDLSDVTYIDADTHREIYSRCDVQKGDLLYVKDGVNTGRVAINPLDEQFSLLSSVAVLRPGPAVSGKYLAYALQESQTLERMLDDMAGVAITRLTLRKLNDAEIPLAPLNSQTRIVEKLEELLSDLDAGVTELKAAQRKLAQYRQSLLKAAVEGALTANWRATRANTTTPQETGAELLQRILTERRARWEAKQLAKFAEQGKIPPTGWKTKYQEPAAPETTNLPALPGGWVWASVEQLGDVQLGRQRSPNKVGGADPTPYIRAANVTEAGVDLSDVLEMDFSENEKRTFALKVGDVLLTEASGSAEHVGRPAIWKHGEGLYCFQNTVLRFSPQGVTSEYAFFSFLAMQKLGVFRKLSGGVGINHLSAGKFCKLSLPLPPVAEQSALIERIEQNFALSDDQLASIGHAIEQSAAQRKNILKAAFAGRLVPQDPNDEPASALLERIFTERAAKGSTGTKRGRTPRKTA